MIPKIIHYCWFGNASIPEKDRKCIESWKKFCPDYEIKLWNESNYDISKNKYMREAYESGKWGFVPDYARLDIVYRHGGLYLDTDVEIIKNFDDLLANKAFMGFEKEGAVAPGLGFGAEKESKIIRYLMEWYEEHSFLDERGKPILTASPAINTQELQKIGLKQDGSRQMLLNELTVYPADFFCPMDYENREMNITENTYSIHHYASSWMPEEEIKAHMNRIKYRNRYGEKGAIIAKIVNFPIRLKFHIKDKGVGGTVCFAINKIKGGLDD